MVACLVAQGELSILGSLNLMTSKKRKKKHQLSGWCFGLFWLCSHNVKAACHAVPFVGVAHFVAFVAFY